MRQLFLMAAMLVAALLAWGQTSVPDVEKYLGMINSGKADDVRREIPTLLSQYPNNPGVLYLQALVTKEGAEAVRIYQSIVDNFPHCEWADDALYRVYQYYYALGLYRTAEFKMDQLKKEYSTSKYLRGAAEQPNAAPVSEKAPDTAAAPGSPTAKAVEPQTRFTLQVGAYTTQVNAEKQKLFFEDLGYAVEVNSKIKDNRSLFIVLVGTFPGADEAKAKAQEFKEKYNISSLMITK